MQPSGCLKPNLELLEESGTGCFVRRTSATTEPVSQRRTVVRHVALLGNSLSLFIRLVEGFGSAKSVGLVLRRSHWSFHTSRSVEEVARQDPETQRYEEVLSHLGVFGRGPIHSVTIRLRLYRFIHLS